MWTIPIDRVWVGFVECRHDFSEVTIKVHKNENTVERVSVIHKVLRIVETSEDRKVKCDKCEAERKAEEYKILHPRNRTKKQDEGIIEIEVNGKTRRVRMVSNRVVVQPDPEEIKKMRLDKLKKRPKIVFYTACFLRVCKHEAVLPGEDVTCPQCLGPRDGEDEGGMGSMEEAPVGADRSP